MIKGIYSPSFGSKDYLSKKKANKNVVENSLQTAPIKSSLYNYSTANLKANYMPLSTAVSFGNNNKKPGFLMLRTKDGQQFPMEMPEAKKALVNISALPKAERVPGDYYSEFADDLSVLLRSNKHAVLVKEEGVDSEIFAHSLANHIENSPLKNGAKPKVIFLNGPIAAEKEALQDAIQNELIKQNGNLEMQDGHLNLKAPYRSVIGLLADISRQDNGSKKVVVVEDYDLLEDRVLNHLGDKFNGVGESFAKLFPNLSIVGIVKKPEPKVNMLGQKVEQDVKYEFPKLALSGLNTEDAKNYLSAKKDVLDTVLSEYPEAKLKFSSEALDTLVEKSAILIEGALPGSAVKMAKLVAAAKVSESDIKTPGQPLEISVDDVKGFFREHSKLVDLYKNETGRFQVAEKVSIKLSDVGGNHAVKEAIQEDLIAYLKNPKQFVADRGEAPKGFLFEGPPGTGKTLMARAIAGETNTPFISASGSEFVEKYVGVGAQRVRELFATARQAAASSANKTAIVFIDEFDAVAKQRTGNTGGSQESEQTLNQLLTEMDGFDNKESKIKVIVLAATNRKDMLDSAVVRPGRFDDSFKVANPRTQAERLEILSIHAKKMNFASEEEKAKILDEAAKMTDDMSGAELAEVMKKAQKVVSKRHDNKIITHNDVVEGLLQVIAGPVQKNAEERPFEDIVKTVRHEGGHATAIDFLKPLFNEKISFITLDSRGDFLGAVFHHSPKVNPNLKSVILSAAVSYAGGLAEPGFDSEGRAAGARQDLNNATRLFRRAVTEWGQGVFTPPIGLAPVDGGLEGASADTFYHTMQSANQQNIQKDINLLSKTSEKVAEMVNEFHSDFLDNYVKRFVDNAGKGGNNLSGEEFGKLRQAWLQESGKVEAEQKLLKKVSALLDDAYNANSGFFTRMFKKLARAVK